MRLLLVLGILLSTACVRVDAQKGYEIGGWLGLAHYFGDLNSTYKVNRPGIAGGLVGRYNFNTRISVKLSANYGRVSAFDSDSDNQFQLARNLSFRTDIIEGAGQIEFNFLPYTHGSRDDFFTPYLFGGFGFLYANPKAELNGEWVALQPLGTEGQPIGGEYNKGQVSLVYGAGFKLDLSYAWSLNIELSARALFSDYLDDVSTVYPNSVELQALRGDIATMLSDRSLEVGTEAIGEQGRQRGTSTTNDAYAFLQVGIVYYIGTLLCPPISRPR